MAWLSGWSKRIKLTTDCTKVDSDLTHFAITVFLKSGNGETTKVFDEVGDNKYKIAIADDSAIPVEFYVEIEKWDNANQYGILHFGKSGQILPSASDKDYYLYYDNTHADNTSYVGEPNSAPAQNVWNSNFGAVYHFAEQKRFVDLQPERRPFDSADVAIGNMHTALMSNGNLISISCMGPLGDGGVYESISTDKGETWSNFTLIKAAGVDWWAIGQGVLVTNTGRVLAFYQRYKSFPGDSKLYCMYSDDDGGSWSSDFLINMGKNYVANAVQYHIQLQTGTYAGRILVGMGYWDGIRFQAKFAYSDNDGISWSLGNDITKASGNGVDEPSPVELSDGSIWVALRTDTGTAYYTKSTDGGVNWTAPATTGLTAPNNSVLVYRLTSSPNEIVIFTNDSPSNRYPVVARVSTDDCVSWSAVRSLLVDSHNQTALAISDIDGTGTYYLVGVWDNRAAYLNEGFGYMVSRTWFEYMLQDSTGNSNDASSVRTDPAHDIFKGGSATASKSYSTYTPDKAFNDNYGTGGSDRWICDSAGSGDWLKYDLGSGVAKALKRFLINCYKLEPIKDFKVQGSNNDVGWDDLGTYQGVDINPDGGTQTFYISSPARYRYYRFYLTSAPWHTDLGIIEINGYEDIQQTQITNDYTQGFDYTTGEIRVPAGSGVNAAAEMTFEVVIETIAVPATAGILGKWNIGQNGYGLNLLTNGAQIGVYRATKSTDLQYTGGALPTDTKLHLSARYSESGNILALYQNGTLLASSVLGSGSFSGDSQPLGIGRDIRISAYPYLGYIYEVRISQACWSVAWLKATSNSTLDTLLTYGSEETSPIGGAPSSGMAQKLQAAGMI